MSTDASAPPAPPAPPATPTASGRARTLALVVILLASFMDLLDVTIMNVALPSLREDLGASPAQSQWLLAGYTLAFALGIVTGARLGDLYGYRRVFLVGVAGFTLASALCAVAPGAGALVATRVVQGVFAAAMVPQVLSQIQLMYAPHERGGAMAAFSSLNGLASAVGPILGAALLEADPFGQGWRAVFWLNVPVGVVALVVASRALPEGRAGTRPRLDPLGMLLSGAGLVLVLYPLIAGSEERPWPAWTYVCLTLGVAVLFLFHRHEKGLSAAGRTPLVEMSLFRLRPVGGGLLLQFLFFLPVMGFFLTFMQLLQAGLEMGPMAAGVAILPWPIATVLGAGLGAAVLLPRFGRVTVQLGLVVLAVGFLLLALIARSAGPGATWLDFLPGVTVGGLGLGLTVAPLAALTLEGIPGEHAGSGSGLFNTVAQLAASAGVAVMGTVFFAVRDSHPDGRAHGYVPGFTATMGAGLGLIALCFAVSFLLPRRSAPRSW
ncbi:MULTISPECIES: MFS transporter [Streptomyces]|uniref:MFS transporter n=1 Tax=Streptomyces TaxID=1883 RepID=UPI00163B9FC4|nr:MULTISPECIES: MFS transporter [Streptomyces]MBC2878459.1 MFS transporter [Streptomyces sp. TYQ1024]UBI38791.1 MFS transporter [Streptomyces mobaraensis]UKW31372.1 MFS transporter [Streptomyces sp. TYQ1024]